MRSFSQIENFSVDAAGFRKDSERISQRILTSCQEQGVISRCEPEREEEEEKEQKSQDVGNKEKKKKNKNLKT